jgi:hypothetical protein
MSLAPVSGNFNKVAKSLMDKLPHMNDKRTFILQQYAFNVLVKDQFVFLAIVSLPPHTTPDTPRASSLHARHVFKRVWSFFLQIR